MPWKPNTYYSVYELINTLGSIEYVGVTNNPPYRFWQHTKRSDGRNGKFLHRSDITMYIVCETYDKKEALQLEGKLKLEYGMEWTEKTRSIKGGKNIPHESRVKGGLSTYKTNFAKRWNK